MFRSVLSLPALGSILALALTPAQAEPPAWSGSPDQQITIETLPGMMKYNQQELVVGQGKKVKLTFKNPDDLAHNLVLLNADPADKTGVKFAESAFALGEKGLAMAWTPDSPRVLAKSGMLNPKAETQIYFESPKKPGSYPFVCTVPGHAQLMRGILKVTGASSSADLKEVTYALYKLKGAQKLPDFSKLKPVSTGKAKGNFLSLDVAKKFGSDYGIVWEGGFTVPKTENYEFFLGSDDGSRLSIDGELEIDNDGTHPMQVKKKKVKLEKGEHRFRVTYFQGGGEAEFSLYAKARSRGEVFFSSKASTRKPRRGRAPRQPMLLKPFRPTEAIVHRTFLGGGTQPRSIAVGYPGGINLAWNADTMNLNLLWRGGFIDVAGHWNGRGSGSKISGFDSHAVVSGMALQVLESATTPWVKYSVDKVKYERDKNAGDQQKEITIGVPHPDYDFKGYHLDSNRFPTFKYKFKDMAVNDRFDPAEVDGIEAIVRTLEFSGTPAKGTHLLVGTGGSYSVENGWFDAGGPIRIKVEGARPIVRESGGEKQLLIAITKATSVKITYRWSSAIGGKVK
ncbi:MAG: PA14 domain-containing protein [Akkermansiaceae bacterium]|jgi:azurin